MAETDSRGVRESLTRGDLGWWLLGVVLLGVLVLVALEFLAWLVFGLFVYYVARPVSRRLEGKTGMPGLSAAVTLFLIVVPLVVALGALLLVALGQLVSLLADAPVDRIVAALPYDVGDLPDSPNEIYETSVFLIQDPTVQSVVGQVGALVGAIGATLFNFFVSLLVAFFLLVSDRRLARWFEAEVLGENGTLTGYLRSVDVGLKSVFFGYTVTIFVVMVATSVLYVLFNAVAPGGLVIPSAVLLGVLTGVLTLLPLVGRSVVYLFIAGILTLQAVQTDPRLVWVPVGFLAVMIVVFDNVIRTYVRPALSGRIFDVSLVVFAYVFGPPLFGWYGIFLGPLLLVFIVTFVRQILPFLANPGRERESMAADHTLEEYETRLGQRGEPGERPPADRDRGDVEPG